MKNVKFFIKLIISQLYNNIFALSFSRLDISYNIYKLFGSLLKIIKILYIKKNLFVIGKIIKFRKFNSFSNNFNFYFIIKKIYLVKIFTINS